jgi:hypothetical protein
VDPRAGLDAVARRKNPSPCRESNAGRPARSLVTILTELPLLPVCLLSNKILSLHILLVITKLGQ